MEAKERAALAEKKALLDSIQTARSDFATVKMGPEKSEYKKVSKELKPRLRVMTSYMLIHWSTHTLTARWALARMNKKTVPIELTSHLFPFIGQNTSRPHGGPWQE